MSNEYIRDEELAFADIDWDYTDIINFIRTYENTDNMKIIKSN